MEKLTALINSLRERLERVNEQLELFHMVSEDECEFVWKLAEQPGQCSRGWLMCEKDALCAGIAHMQSFAAVLRSAEGLVTPMQLMNDVHDTFVAHHAFSSELLVLNMAPAIQRFELAKEKLAVLKRRFNLCQQQQLVVGSAVCDYIPSDLWLQFRHCFGSTSCKIWDVIFSLESAVPMIDASIAKVDESQAAMMKLEMALLEFDTAA